MTSLLRKGYVSFWDDYTDSQLQILIDSTKSAVQMLDRLNRPRNIKRGNRLVHSGGLREALIAQIRKRGLNTDSWGYAPKMRDYTVSLVQKNSGSRVNSLYLREGLLQLGIPLRCNDPDHAPDPRPLPLDVEHINGDKLDCRPENLEFLCKNCHSLRETSSSSRQI